MSCTKLESLRDLLRQKNLSAYIVPSGDPHMSEYEPDAFKRRSWISEFTGSAGSAIITLNSALLWTDGRYWTQAEKQLSKDWTLMKAGLPQTPKISEWLSENILNNSVIGIDGTVIDYEFGRVLVKKLSKKNISIEMDGINLIDQIWKDRPELPESPIELLPRNAVQYSVQEKNSNILKELKKNNATGCILCDLADIAWYLNIRGRDISMNPYVMSWVFVTLDTTHIFIKNSRVTDSLKTHLSSIQVEYHDYNDIYNFMKQYIKQNPQCSIIYGKNEINYLLGSICESNKNDASTFIPMMKAVKLPVEIAHLRDAYIRDSIALSTLLAKLDHAIKNSESITEMTIADLSTSYRRDLAKSVDNSFDPIIAFGQNASSPHYEPSNEHPQDMCRGTCILLDTGGQYQYGTTDITRTLWFDLKEGESIDATKINAVFDTSKDIKEQYEHMKSLYRKTYTAVLKGHIALSNSIFPVNTSGALLDIYARQFLYQLGLDYNHGTGHGVGYYSGVHEAPPSISSRVSSHSEGFKAGMVVSDEPGYYLDTKFGIRIETCLLSVPMKMSYDRTVLSSNDTQKEFLCFEPLSFVPIQVDCCDIEMFTPQEKQWLINYNSKCYTLLSPEIRDEMVLNWLKEQKEITEKLLA